MQDDRRARLESLEHAVDIGAGGERGRPPAQVGRVVADLDLLALLDEAEGGIANAGGADESLDVRLREQRVEALRLAARDDERLLLPMLGEELLGRGGFDCER